MFLQYIHHHQCEGHESLMLIKCACYNVQYKDSEVLFYRRFVDDTFCLFNSELGAVLFFQFINNQHPNVHFAIEIEESITKPYVTFS